MTARKRRLRPPKVDFNNVDKEEGLEMISSYQQQAKDKVPLLINAKLTILVTADKCNEKYRQQYIKKKLNERKV